MLIRRLQAGVRTGHLLLRVKKASVIRQGKVNSWLEICLDEGKNRQIRRIFQALEIEVLRIVRIAVGPLVLGTLPKGAIRELTSKELASIDAALGAIRPIGAKHIGNTSKSKTIKITGVTLPRGPAGIRCGHEP